MLVRPGGNAVASSRSCFRRTATVRDPPLTDRLRFRCGDSSTPIASLSIQLLCRLTISTVQCRAAAAERWRSGRSDDRLPAACCGLAQARHSSHRGAVLLCRCTAASVALRLHRSRVNLSLVQRRRHRHSCGSRGAVPSGRQHSAVAGGSCADRRLSRRPRGGCGGSARGVGVGSAVHHVRNAQYCRSVHFV